MYIDENTKEVFEKAFELMKQGVVAAADTLKTYAPQLWAMARRQTILEGYQMVGGMIVVLALFAFFLWLLRRNYAELPEHKNDGNDNPWNKSDANAVTALLSVVTLIILTVLAVNASDCLLNPDFWTLKRILEMRGQ